MRPIGRSSIVGSHVRIVYPSSGGLNSVAANATLLTAAMLMASDAVLLLGYPRVRSRALWSPNNQAGGDHASFWTQPFETRPSVSSDRRDRSRDRRYGSL